MDKYEFEATAHAKCVLAGEHAVLRGYPAIVLPMVNQKIILNYQAGDNSAHADYDAPYGESLLIYFWEALHRGMELLRRDKNELHGNFFIKNDIPMGTGMGFSAALCVVVTQWFIWKKWLAEPALFSFARNLENIFHGQSSGVDIAGSLSDTSIIFWITGSMVPITMKWNPNLCLSFSDKCSSTAECIDHVNKLWINNRILAESIDGEMEASVYKAESALKMNSKEGLSSLADAIHQAYYCFNAWKLVNPELKNHIQCLLEAGAVAAKPTGSGNGGFVLSLWQDPPDSNLPFELNKIL